VQFLEPADPELDQALLMAIRDDAFPGVLEALLTMREMRNEPLGDLRPALLHWLAQPKGTGGEVAAAIASLQTDFLDAVDWYSVLREAKAVRSQTDSTTFWNASPGYIRLARSTDTAARALQDPLPRTVSGVYHCANWLLRGLSDF